jgi:hypothetical protein
MRGREVFYSPFLSGRSSDLSRIFRLLCYPLKSPEGGLIYWIIIYLRMMRYYSDTWFLDRSRSCFTGARSYGHR